VLAFFSPVSLSRIDARIENNIMLNSLKIENFRILEDLYIESLGRVNLIVGKNNSGKTTVLEALNVYANLGLPRVLKDILDHRDELSKVDTFSEIFYLPVEKLFTHYQIKEKQEIYIGDKDGASYISIKHVYLKKNNNEITSSSKEVDSFPKVFGKENILPALKISFYNNKFKSSQIASFLEDPNTPIEFYTYIYNEEENSKFNLTLKSIDAFFPRSFVSSAPADSQLFASIWDEIALTDKENSVIKALKLFDERLTGITFKSNQNHSNKRTAFIKLAGEKAPVPLKSMGEGMLRVFQFILAAINAQDGFLYVDEFENGLHYTIQPQVWTMIFQLAHDLNIQVFATTHSWDCITAFQQAAQASEESAMLFRLGRSRLTSDQGKIIATSYNKKELQAITQAELEIR